jgi:hypothetical protein
MIHAAGYTRLRPAHLSLIQIGAERLQTNPQEIVQKPKHQLDVHTTLPLITAFTSCTFPVEEGSLCYLILLFEVSRG